MGGAVRCMPWSQAKSLQWGIAQMSFLPQLRDAVVTSLPRPWPWKREKAVTTLLTIALVVAFWTPITVVAIRWIAHA